jgi:hypothetical protein
MRIRDTREHGDFISEFIVSCTAYLQASSFRISGKKDTYPCTRCSRRGVLQRLHPNDVNLTKLDKLNYDSNFEPKSCLQLFGALNKNGTLTKLDLSGFSGLGNEVKCVCVCVCVCDAVYVELYVYAYGVHVCMFTFIYFQKERSSNHIQQLLCTVYVLFFVSYLELCMTFF